MMKVTDEKQLNEHIGEVISIVKETVLSTMGPGGRNVIIETPNGSPIVTKDGVTVAKNLKLDSVVLDILKQASLKTVDEAGDGTTTTMALASVMVSEGLKFKSDGILFSNFKKGMTDARDKIIETLKSYAKQISENDIETLEHVGLISSNYDQDITNIALDIYRKTGKNGIIKFDINKNEEDIINIREGFTFNSGYASQFFIKDKGVDIVWKDPLFFISDLTLTTTELKKILLAHVEHKNPNLPLIIIAQDWEQDVLKHLLEMSRSSEFKVCLIKSPGFGNNRTEYVKCIAAVTGGEYYLEELGGIRENIKLGSSGEIIIGKKSTSIIKGKGDVSELVKSLEKELEATKGDYDRSIIEERLGSLKQSIANVFIGGSVESEAIERKDRCEDAYFAIKSALDGGVIPGGGLALFKIGINLIKEFESKTQDKNISKQMKSYNRGYNTVLYSTLIPITVITENMGMKVEEIEEFFKLIKNTMIPEKLEFVDIGKSKKDFFKGVDFFTGEVVDFMDKGILDPVKVTISALKNSVAVASTLLSVKSSLTFKERSQLKTFQTVF